MIRRARIGWALEVASGGSAATSNTRDDLDVYLETVFGDDDGGYVALAFGLEPCWTQKGKYRHDRRREGTWQWPEGRDRLREVVTTVLQSGKPVDVYVCPVLRRTTTRRKGAALRPTVCWVDLDAEPTDVDLYKKLEPFEVASGQDGHRHGYVRLSEPVDLDEHRALQVALRDRLGGDDKIADNDLLRLAGTLNHKPATAPNTGEPGQVRITSAPGTRWNPRELAELLGVDLDNPPTQERARVAGGSSQGSVATFVGVDGEPVNDADIPAWLRKRFADAAEPDDRSDALYGLVGACKDAHLSQGQTVTLMSQWPPGVAKYGDRLADQVAACWVKLGDDDGLLGATAPVPSPVAPVSLAACHEVFRKWLGEEYDLAVLDIMLCALAVERLDGDPVWLLIISGPGATKTETVQASAGAGALVESTVTGEAALLSGTPKHEWAKNATGGLLKRLGDNGILVIKDFTSILSMSRDRRAEVLAALREVYDGRWSRSVGGEGGLTLLWEGRIALVAAVTTAWDSAHSVISAMGDRFINARLDSAAGKARLAAGKQTAANTGSEVAMRAELAEAVGGVIAGIDRDVDLNLEDAEVDRLLAAADLVTLARTGVEYDYKGDVVDAHAPEMPTRFLRQLQQVMRGGLALGMSRERCMHLAVRAARDSMPPIRLSIVDWLAAHPSQTWRVADIRRGVDLPWRTVDRQCQALHMLGVVRVDENEGSDGRSKFFYGLAAGIDADALTIPPDPDSSVEQKVSPDLAEGPPTPPGKRGSEDSGNREDEGVYRHPPANTGDVSAHVDSRSTASHAAAGTSVGGVACSVVGCEAMLSPGRAVIFTTCVDHRHLEGKRS